MKISIKALQLFFRNMLENEHMEFVLLGKCQSDELVSRLGWIKQLSDGNYYISCQQILESNKLINVRWLVKY